MIIEWASECDIWTWRMKMLNTSKARYETMASERRPYPHYEFTGCYVDAMNAFPSEMRLKVPKPVKSDETRRTPIS